VEPVWRSDGSQPYAQRVTSVTAADTTGTYSANVGTPLCSRGDRSPSRSHQSATDLPTLVHGSRRANRGATATSNRSTAGSATNASTSTSSGPSPEPTWSSATGRRTTTTADGTARSATKPQRSMLPPAPID